MRKEYSSVLEFYMCASCWFSRIVNENITNSNFVQRSVLHLHLSIIIMWGSKTQKVMLAVSADCRYVQNK